MRKLVLFVAIASAFPLGCVGMVKKDVTWAATGGSRADATVELSYQYAPINKPIANDAQGLAVAVARCQAWGYADAEPFGGTITRAAGDGTFLVTKTYQCLGQGVETPQKR